MSTINNRTLGLILASQDRLVGGYLYGGTTFGLAVEGESRIPRLEQLVHSTKEHDRRPMQGLIAHNKRRLASLPVGSEVSMYTRLAGFSGGVVYKKVGPCLWEEVDAWEEEIDE